MMTMNTEEAFILASLKEFVRLWGSGTQASFHLECRNRKAWFKLATELGAPSSRHFIPPPVPSQDHHGPHGNGGVPPQPRRQGPGRRRRNQARAAAHRAQQSEQLADPVNYADVTAADSCSSRQDIPSPAAPASTPQPQSPTSPEVAAAATLPSPRSHLKAAASADHLHQHPPVAAAAAGSLPLICQSEVPLHFSAPHRPNPVTATVRVPVSLSQQHQAASASIHPQHHQVQDEVCPNQVYERVDFMSWAREVQEQARQRREQATNFGFNPANSKPPF